jgi:hypothetical protein
VVAVVVEPHKLAALIQLEPVEMGLPQQFLAAA